MRKYEEREMEVSLHDGCVRTHTCVCVSRCVGEITEKESNKSVCVCVQRRDEGQDRKRGSERESVCGRKDSVTEGKSDQGLKVLRLRVLGLRSEDIIVMFCFH